MKRVLAAACSALAVVACSPKAKGPGPDGAMIGARTMNAEARAIALGASPPAFGLRPRRRSKP
jgi:hypothetical protein